MLKGPPEDELAIDPLGVGSIPLAGGDALKPGGGVGTKAFDASRSRRSCCSRVSPLPRGSFAGILDGRRPSGLREFS